LCIIYMHVIHMHVVARGAWASADPRSGPCTRYAEQGVDGLLRDKTRKPCRAPHFAQGPRQGYGRHALDRPRHVDSVEERRVLKAAMCAGGSCQRGKLSAASWGEDWRGYGDQLGQFPQILGGGRQ
jgi:hypothetical protein